MKAAMTVVVVVGDVGAAVAAQGDEGDVLAAFLK